MSISEVRKDYYLKSSIGFFKRLFDSIDIRKKERREVILSKLRLFSIALLKFSILHFILSFGLYFLGDPAGDELKDNKAVIEAIKNARLVKITINKDPLTLSLFKTFFSSWGSRYFLLLKSLFTFRFSQIFSRSIDARHEFGFVVPIFLKRFFSSIFMSLISFCLVLTFSFSIAKLILKIKLLRENLFDPKVNKINEERNRSVQELYKLQNLANDSLSFLLSSGIEGLLSLPSYFFHGVLINLAMKAKIVTLNSSHPMIITSLIILASVYPTFYYSILIKNLLEQLENKQFIISLEVSGIRKSSVLLHGYFSEIFVEMVERFPFFLTDFIMNSVILEKQLQTNYGLGEMFFYAIERRDHNLIIGSICSLILIYQVLNSISRKIRFFIKGREEEDRRMLS